MLTAAVLCSLAVGWCTGGRLSRFERAGVRALLLPVAALLLQGALPLLPSLATLLVALSYLLLLLFVAKFNNVHDGVEIGLERQNAGGVFMQLFHEQDQRELVTRNAANLFRKAKMHEAQLAESHGCF